MKHCQIVDLIESTMRVSAYVMSVSTMVLLTPVFFVTSVALGELLLTIYLLLLIGSMLVMFIAACVYMNI